MLYDHSRYEDDKSHHLRISENDDEEEEMKI